MAFWILYPGQGLSLGPLHQKLRVLTLDHQGNPCFHILAVVNSTAMNTGWSYLFELVVPPPPLDIYQEIELLNYMVVLFLVFSEKPTYSFPRVCSYLHSNTVLQFPCYYTVGIYILWYIHLSTPPPTFVICRLFDDSHSDTCKVISHCGFDLHFSGD